MQGLLRDILARELVWRILSRLGCLAAAHLDRQATGVLAGRNHVLHIP